MKTNLLKTSSAFAIISFLFFFSFTFSSKDTRLIKGRVTDTEMGVLIGASIIIEDTKKGTMSDLDGSFEMIVPISTKYIRVEMVGYKSKKIKLSSESTYEIVLEEGAVLEEVVVTGYGSVKRKSLFSSRRTPSSEYAPSPAKSTVESKPTEDAAVYSYDKHEGESSEIIEEEGAVSESRDVKKEREKAGQLTAGEWNDLNNWEDWKKLVEEKDYKQMGKYWNIRPVNRVSVYVSNQYELPIPDCHVQLISGSEVLWSTKTDNAGKAELWAKDSSAKLRLKVSSRKNSFKSEKVLMINQGVNKVIFEEECDAPTKAEIMFVVDATGSMGDEIEFLKSELSDVIKQVESKRSSIDFRWGSVFYRDATDSYLTRQSPLSDDEDRVLNFINMQSAGGGGDYPEAVNEGMEEALMQEWSEDAIARIVFLVLDAPPHHNKEVLGDLQSQMEYAASLGIKIIPITASGINRQTEYLMKFMSILTNGTYVFLTDHSGIGSGHLDPIVKDYEVEKLNDLLVRLVNNYTDPGTCIQQQEEDPIFTEIEVFPNPAVDFVQVKVPKGVTKISLTTSTGMIIHSEKIDAQCDVNLDLTSYIDGMYMVNFYTKDDVYSVKVVKNNKA